MTRSLVSAEQHSASRPATITELFDEYDAYLFRVRNLAFDTVKIRRLYLNRAATLLSVGTAADHFFALTPRRLMSAVAGYALRGRKGQVVCPLKAYKAAESLGGIRRTLPML